MTRGKEWWYEVKKLLISITANSLIGEDIERLRDTFMQEEIKRRSLSLDRILTKQEIREIRLESLPHAFYQAIKTSVLSRVLVFFPLEKRTEAPIFFKPTHELPLTAKEVEKIKRLVDKAIDLYTYDLQGKDAHEIYELSILRGLVKCIESSFKGEDLSDLIWGMFKQVIKMEIVVPKKFPEMV